jgi:hypothetical protein
MNLFGAIGLFLILVLAFFIGKFAAQYIGWLAFVPAGAILFIFFILAMSSLWHLLKPHPRNKK